MQVKCLYSSDPYIYQSFGKYLFYNNIFTKNILLEWSLHERTFYQSFYKVGLIHRVNDWYQVNMYSEWYEKTKVLTCNTLYFLNWFLWSPPYLPKDPRITKGEFKRYYSSNFERCHLMLEWLLLHASNFILPFPLMNNFWEKVVIKFKT